RGMRPGVMDVRRQRYCAVLDQRGIVDIDFVLGELRPDAGVERYPIGTTCARCGCRHDHTPPKARPTSAASDIRVGASRVQNRANPMSPRLLSLLIFVTL